MHLNQSVFIKCKVMGTNKRFKKDTTISMGYKDLGVCRLVFRQNPGNSYSDCVVKRRNFSTELLVLLEYLF